MAGMISLEVHYHVDLGLLYPIVISIYYYKHFIKFYIQFPTAVLDFTEMVFFVN